jgi:branched-chain amino acid transport system permease protein
LYALFGLGLSLSLGVMRMINLAHGDLIVLGAYLSSVVIVGTGLGPLASLPLLITAVSVAVYGATHALVARTHWGRQARAVSDDPSTARLVGVQDQRLFALMTGFILAVISLASVLYGIRTPFAPSAGPERLIYAFEAVVLGGLGNIWGTFVGGLVIGIAQVLGTKIDTGLGPFFGHLVFLVALVARPQGLFRKATT